MKRAFVFPLVAAVVFSAASTLQAGSEQIIKQRAKDLRDQNNARQGVPPTGPRPSQAPAGGAAIVQQQRPATAMLTPQQQAISRLSIALSAFKPGTTATDALKQSLARELTANARAAKPSASTAAKAAESLSAALSEKLLSQATYNRIAKNLEAILNPQSTPPVQLADLITDIQGQFRANGVSAPACSAVTSSVRTLLSETKRSS